jgi:glucosamine--fructose-6-phosphate aminotransferase (isomerizing)
VVHNGIIENHEEQRQQLKALGYEFTSQTDTEVIAHLVHHYYQGGVSLFDAVKQATRELTGAYAIGVIALDRPDELVCARMGCPLLVGLGEASTSSLPTCLPSCPPPVVSSSWKRAISACSPATACAA